MAIMRMLKWTVLLVAQYLEQVSGDNGCVRCVTGCAICIINCLENICEYLTENAFCYIAVTGDSFFHGAYCSMLLQVKHLAEFWWTATLAKFFMFLSKVAVLAGNAAFYYFVLNPLMVKSSEKDKDMGPLVVVCLISYIMVSIFIGMYDVASDSMMMCYAIDCDT
jgi:choline transporter-like protein 2/4/5